MASVEHRWQAGMGAITGALIADSIRAGSTVWTDRGRAMLAHAEDLLRGHPTPIDLTAHEGVAVAVGLADAAPPLLMDAAMVELIDATRGWLDGADPLAFTDAGLVQAADLARGSLDFESMVATPDDDVVALLAGALRGLERGIGAIPARRVAAIGDPDGRRGRRYVSRLVDRMLRLERNDWYDARSRRGPKEVLPGVWLANIHGLGAFTTEHPDGLVLSLCDIEGRLDDHEHQITFHLDDSPKAEANPDLGVVLDEVLHEVRTARAGDQPVLVHCRHGASRTGLILRLLLAEEHGLDAEDALMEAQCVWPHTSTWNAAWNRVVDRRCSASRADSIAPSS
ncbi:MAG: hypothetical protein AAF567_16020 [Actinomycetota bacterium]